MAVAKVTDKRQLRVDVAGVMRCCHESLYRQIDAEDFTVPTDEGSALTCEYCKRRLYLRGDTYYPDWEAEGPGYAARRAKARGEYEVVRVAESAREEGE